MGEGGRGGGAGRMSDWPRGVSSVDRSILHREMTPQDLCGYIYHSHIQWLYHETIRLCQKNTHLSK